MSVLAAMKEEAIDVVSRIFITCTQGIIGLYVPVVVGVVVGAWIAVVLASIGIPLFVLVQFVKWAWQS